MANLKPEDYYKVGEMTPIRSSRIRFQETDGFDDKTLKSIPATVDFAGQNDRVTFLGMNKKGVVRMMTFRILNKDKTIAKPEEEIASIENDMDFYPVEITAYVKKVLGRKYEDILITDPTKADQFITQYVNMSLNGDSKAYFVKSIEIIQTPWDPNKVPPQELKKVEAEKPEEKSDATPKVEETPVPSPVVETPTTQQPVRVRGEYVLEVVKPITSTSDVTKDEPKDKNTIGPKTEEQIKQEAANNAAGPIFVPTNEAKTQESTNGTKVVETKDVNIGPKTEEQAKQEAANNAATPGVPFANKTENEVKNDTISAVLKVIGPNGNLVLFPDGTRRDLGELTVIKRENPLDPEILKILNEEYEIPPGEDVLDEEYIETEFTGEEEAQVEAAALQMKLAMEDTKDYEEFNKIWMSVGSGGGGGDGGGDGGGASFGTIGAGSGSVSGKLNFAPDKSKNGRGCISKNNRTQDELVRIMFDYVEGGYYHPIIGWTKFSKGDRELYGSSGETMWGLDRYAGQTEANPNGAAFWAEIDKISGNGDYGRSGLARKTPTRKWDISAHPAKSGAWKWGYEPKTTKGSELLQAAIDYAKARYKENLKANFKSSKLYDIIQADNRFQFLYYRATWNGAGWYQRYAKNLKSVYKSIGDDTDKLIIADLNYRHSFSSSLIKHDAKIIARLIGATN